MLRKKSRQANDYTGRILLALAVLAIAAIVTLKLYNSSKDAGNQYDEAMNKANNTSNSIVNEMPDL